ncbi:MAG: xylulokinase [Faecalibacterium sp.]
MMKYTIGIDLGTQSSKGVLVSPTGEIVTQATVQYLPDYPQPNWAEQDTQVWVNAFKEIVRELMFKSAVPASEIGTIGFASQCGSMVPVDEHCEALDKCIIWLDRRSEEQCPAIRAKIPNSEACELVGAPISSGLRAPKIMWLRENKPEIYEKATAFLECGEFMVYHLTGAIVSDYSHASITGLYDVAKREWSQKMLDYTGIPIEKLPPIRPAAEIAGTIRHSIANEWGLSLDTKFVVGVGDQFGAAIGSGLVAPGDILNIMGTAEVIASISDHAVCDKSLVLRGHLHADPRYWQIEQGALISGAAVRWFRDNVSRVSFDDMNALAEQSPAGANGLVFFSGMSGATSPQPNDMARGIFFGMTLGTKLGDLTRAVYEGCACGFRDSIDALQAIGLGSGDIIAAGGGINSKIWMQIKADMSGKRIRTLAESDSTPVGAAMLACVAEGNFRDFAQCAEKMVSYGAEYEPNLANKAIYDDIYGFYRNLYYTSEPLFEHYRRFGV